MYKRECHLFANTAICVCYIPPVFVLTFNIHRQIITTILIQNNSDFLSHAIKAYSRLIFRRVEITQSNCRVAATGLDEKPTEVRHRFVVDEHLN